MNNNTNYLLKKEFVTESFQLLLPDGYKLENEGYKNLTEKIYDTFDWRLLINNFLLLYDNNEYCLNSIIDSKILWKHKSIIKKTSWFYEDLPDSSFSQILKKHVGIRALILQITYNKHIEYFRILNKDKKTVAFLQNINYLLPDENTTKLNIIRLTPVRGYKWVTNEFITKYNENIYKVLNKKQLYLLFLSICKIHPEQFSSKYNLILKPDYKTGEAVIEILKYLSHTAIKNKEGIKEDIDTEFLHDFRVAFRRIRTLLTQIKDVFPNEEIKKYKNYFSEITRRTNRLRDLDVYLLKQNYYNELIPFYLRSGLNPLFSDLKRERKREHNKVVKWLNTAEYESFLSNWERFLNNESTIDEKNNLFNAQLPVKEIAQKYIVRKYKLIFKLGKSITDETPDEKVHALRIECKKLRYLLEFFSSLFQTNKVLVFIKHLKKLQDNLGRFNDLYIQQLDLQRYVENKTANNIKASNTLVAVGALINALYNEQIKERKAFGKIFKEFTNKGNEKLFKSLFITNKKTNNKVNR